MMDLYSRFNISRKHPLTGEYVLDFEEVKTIIRYIQSTECAVILGGDVLDTSYDYTYANWCYEPNGDSWSTQVRQSCYCSLQYLTSLECPEKNLYILVTQFK